MTATSRGSRTGTRAAGACVLVVAASLTLLGCSRLPGRAGVTADVAQGGQLYERYCAPCHGVAGDGAGPAAYLLFPKPRNFQRGEFKLRSTPQGQPPTTADLARTVREGIPGTSMLGFDGLLNDEQIAAVLRHVRSLSPALQGQQESPPAIEVPRAPEVSPRLVEIGRRTYERFGCGQCHGAEGHGDGPAAPTLRDSEGDPFPAADFTYGVYKSGRDPAALYRTLMTGMAGTPMPSFAAAFTGEEEAWGLVYYLLSLADEPPPEQYESGPVQAVEIAAEALEDPWEEAWQAAPARRVRLHPLWSRPGFTPFLTVRAGHTAGRVALILEWRDDTHDVDALGLTKFADGAAVQWAASDPPPFIGMGGGAPGEQVEIWYWRADRQSAADEGRVEALADAYPHMAIDAYPFPAAATEQSPVAVADPRADQAAPFVPARDLGNPVSEPQLLRRPVHTLAARGFGTLTAATPEGMRASGIGSWRDGVYRVVFSAPRSGAEDAFRVDLRRERLPLAVAIWDGAAGDRNGDKLVTQWFILQMPAEPETTAATTAADAARYP